MCLAIPGKVLDIYEDNDLLMGRIDYDGTVNTACLAYVPEAKAGDYVIVFECAAEEERHKPKNPSSNKTGDA
jgi:hydrogenase assembly chaperone HypC/HupF